MGFGIPRLVDTAHQNSSFVRLLSGVSICVGSSWLPSSASCWHVAQFHQVQPQRDIYKIGDMRSTCRVQNHRDGSGRNDQGVSIGKFRSSFVAPYYMDVRYIHTHYNRIYHRRRRTGDQRLLQEVFSAAKVPRLMPPGRTSEHKRPPSPRT